MTAMLSAWGKRLSGSLFIRMVLITIVALIGFVMVFFAAFRSALPFQLNPAVFAEIAQPISDVISLVEDMPADEQTAILAVYSGPTRAAIIVQDFHADAVKNEVSQSLLVNGSAGSEVLLTERDIRFRYILPRARIQDLLNTPQRQFVAFTALEVSVSLSDGRVLAFLFAPASVMIDSPQRVGGLLGVAALVIGIAAAMMIRQSLRPLNKLEVAAERFGATFDPEPVPEEGAEEIRRVTRALNRTQDQVRGLIAQRARLVSALAHDIRTSLTRLRLRIEDSGELDTEAIGIDISQMQTLIDDMLTYAKSGEPSAPKELIDLPAFLLSYADNVPYHVPYKASQSGVAFTIAAEPQALTRAMNNLVENARVYAGGATLRTELNEVGYHIYVDDDGPGLPNHHLSDVFEPFFRLEESRNRETGGSGLGLGIAKGLVEAQGGVLTLTNREPRGLRATIAFPLGTGVS